MLKRTYDTLFHIIISHERLKSKNIVHMTHLSDKWGHIFLIISYRTNNLFFNLLSHDNFYKLRRTLQKNTSYNVK